ncbi:caspase family protein [Amycolatopsis sp. NBC_00355]|uniref:caspase family protein n=1 Tax=Amycolatopsis sp. NBC_00355 TaxID=2975957 RepID=UPI002E2770FB
MSPTGSRRALVIGARTGRLAGVGQDVAAMAGALGDWGFTSTTCEGSDATRAGILAAYSRFIAETREEDAAVVYYSGHGGRSVAPAGGSVQFIVPVDYDESAEDDFRGITSIELTILLTQLTAKTKNVTVVLDSCHAAHMSRDPGKVVKARPAPVPYQHIAAHLDRLRRDDRWLARWTPTGNPDAVRIVACAPEQSAYEYVNTDGIRTGLLTDALSQTLAEAKDSEVTVSWATVVDRVRRRVLALLPAQRPEAEGPARRLLFDVTEADPVATLPAAMVAGRVRLSGAALLGVVPGDEFVVVPGESADPDGRVIGEVGVDRVDLAAAWGELRAPQLVTELPIGARAHLVRAVTPLMPVRLRSPGPRLAPLARAIELAPLIRLGEPGEECPAEVGSDDRSGLVVYDEFGPLHRSRPDGSDGVRRVVRDLTRVARARALRCLSEVPGEELPLPVSIEFGRVDAGRAVPLSTSGSVLHVDQPVYVRVRNESPDTVYVSLLDIGVAAGISFLNPSSPSGVRLLRGGQYTFGGNDLTGALPGVALGWPTDLDRGVPRPETIVVLVTSEPVDSRVLEQEGVRAAPLLAGSALGRSLRSLSGLRSQGRAADFAVRTIDFDLVPAPAPPLDVTRFEVDERPEASTWLWRPETAASADVVVSLRDVSAEPGVRLDVLVVTGSPGGEPIFSARTEYLGASGLDELPVYRGQVTGYLAIAIWVSHGKPGDRSLQELVRERPVADGPDVVEPAALSGVRFTTNIVNTADAALRAVSAGCAGLYRTTLLSHERFGVGRPENRTALRTGQVSFRCLVEETASACPEEDHVGSSSDDRVVGTVPLLLDVFVRSVELAPNDIEIGLIRFSGWQLHRIDPLPAGFAGHAAYLVRVNYEFDVPAGETPPAWAEVQFTFDAAEVVVLDAIPRVVTVAEPARTYELTGQLNFVRRTDGRSHWAADASEANVALPAVRPEVTGFGLGSARVRWRHSGGVHAGTHTAWLVLLTPPDRTELPVLAGGAYHLTAEGGLGLGASGEPDAFTVRLPEAPEADVPATPADDGRPRVFVSYAQESPAHKKAVVELCRLLSGAGVDVRVDQDGLEQRRNWDEWTTTQILRTDYVIVVASPVYRAVGDRELTDETRHRGIRSEYSRLADLLHRDRDRWTQKVLPVVLPGRSPDEIPLSFLPAIGDYYVLSAFTRDAAADLLKVLFTVPAG